MTCDEFVTFLRACNPRDDGRDGWRVMLPDEVAAVDARMASALQRSIATALKEAGFPAACVGETFGETPTTKDALQ